MGKETGVFGATLSCGCKASWGRYESPRGPWNNWGKVDVSPQCEQASHYMELKEKQDGEEGR